MSLLTMPAIQQEYSADFSADAQPTAQYIRNTYGPIIQAAGDSLGVDPNIIIGFMIIESGTGNGTVNPNARSSAGAIGLLQLEPASAFQVLKNQAPNFTSQQANIVQHYLPGFLKVGGFVSFYASAGVAQAIANALLQPEFNIWVGTMQLAQLFKYIINKTGDLHLDQVAIAYNAGQGNYQKYIYSKGYSGSDTTALVSVFPFPETTSYIVKLMGINGSLMAALRTQPATIDPSVAGVDLISPSTVTA